MNLKIEILGDVLGTTGYCSHIKSLAAELNKVADVKITTNLVPGWERMVSDSEFKMISKSFNPEDVCCVFVGLPPFWRFQNNGYKKFAGFFVWEGDRIPTAWVKYLKDDFVNLIFVPSEHTRQAILNTTSEVTDKIVVIPHGVDSEVFKPMVVERSEKFTFVCNKGFNGSDMDRGGVQFLIRAFVEEFKEGEAVLKLHFNPAYMTQETIKFLNVNANKNIQVNWENISNEKICEFYNSGDVFVTTQMADGFNLTGLEAMSCGLPNIQCVFGGQTDYCNNSNGWIVDEGIMVESTEEIYKGVNWFKPSVFNIRQKLREAFETKGDGKGVLALKTAERFSWKNSAVKITNVFYNDVLDQLESSLSDLEEGRVK